MPTTFRTPVPKSIDSLPSHNRARERAHLVARQPLRSLTALALHQVQAATREERRSDLRGPVRLPRMLQKQRIQVRLGTARLAAVFGFAARSGESGKGGMVLPTRPAYDGQVLRRSWITAFVGHALRRGYADDPTSHMLSPRRSIPCGRIGTRNSPPTRRLTASPSRRAPVL